MTYEGFSNRETWVVNLWLNNEIDTYKVLQEIATSNQSNANKEQELMDFVYDYYRIPVTGLCGDLCGISHVDWGEIIESNQEL